MTCVHCNGPTEPHHDYCSWDCHVAAARVVGGVEIRPNGLPIRCIRFDGAMLECEGGDHPTYLFPVDVEGPPALDPEFPEYPQTHALVYTDGCVAVTLYEACYAFWRVSTGEPMGGRYVRPEERLSEAARAQIAEYVARNEGRAGGSEVEAGRLRARLRDTQTTALWLALRPVATAQRCPTCRRRVPVAPSLCRVCALDATDGVRDLPGDG